MINKMRRKALATALALTMIVGTVAGNGMVVKAADGDYEEKTISANAVDENADPLSGLDENPVNIDVEADVTVDNEKYAYNVQIQYGKMKFNYDKGSSWNPQTHSYGTSSAIGWSESDNVQGNNDIIITNHSNMPVSITCQYSLLENLNNTLGATNGVTGVFADDNSMFDYSQSGTGAGTIKMNGTSSGNGNVGTAYRYTKIFATDTSRVKDENGKYMGMIGVLNDTTAPYTSKVWFGLSGIPDKSFSGKVGTIQVIVNKVDKSLYTLKHAGD